MLSPTETATIWAELERLEKAHKDCTDSDLRKWIETEIEKQKKKLVSEQGKRVANGTAED
jgi:hypothetical protein